MSVVGASLPEDQTRTARTGTGRTARLRVLFVTGAYYPEISAAGVQCRAVAAALRGRGDFSVLTTAVTRSLPATDIVDDVIVHRVRLDVRSGLSKASASVRLVRSMLRAARGCDVIHLHGFSQKNVPATALARLLGKPVVLTLHTAGQDEPGVVQQSGRLAYWAFTSPDLVLSVSPYLTERYLEAGLAPERVRLTPNGVDPNRFRPAGRDERLAIRRALGWPETQPIVLFIGFFSRDKRPDLLFRAWRRLTSGSLRARLAYVGATGAGYYEIDASLVQQIRADAAQMGRADDVMFVEPTNQIEQYFRAADVFVLPSAREANPLALLEAMACGLPAVATRLPGATDVLIEDGINGRLFSLDDEPALTEALRDVLTDQPAAWLMGARARETVKKQYDVQRTAENWLAAYDTVVPRRS
jgi:glycosyltransferase involved in cell wall biosynthesis